MLKANDESVLRRALYPLQVEELLSLREANKRKLFDEIVNKRWESSIKLPDNAEVKNDE